LLSEGPLILLIIENMNRYVPSFFFFYVDKKQERIKTYSKNSLLKEYINIYFNEYIPIKIKSLFIIKDTELDWLSELLLIT
jgi:hypothetical protein